MPLISGLPMPPRPGDTTFSTMIDKGTKSCRARRPGVPLRDHENGNSGGLTGPNPVDRGKYVSKIHLITERTGLPLSVGISGANLHDSQALEPLVRGIPPIRSRRGPRRRRPAKLHADKGYDYDHLRRWLRQRGIRHRIACKGIESSQRLGRHRWTIERTMAWLAGCRRYERKAEHFLAFTSIACTGGLPHDRVTSCHPTLQQTPLS
ncbi:IS5 family transposase [Streptomyces sp. NPDC055400]